MKKNYFLFIIGLLLSFGVQAQGDWHYLDYTVDNYKGDLFALNADTVFIVTNYGWIHRSLDGGGTWEAYDTGLEKELSSIKFYNEQLGFTVGEEGTILKTTNGGNTWQEINTSEENNLNAVAFANENEIWATGENGTLLHSTDIGEIWDAINLTSETLNDIAFRENEGYAIGINGTVYYSEDSGSNWVQKEIETTDDLFALNLTETKTSFLAGSTQSYRNQGIQMYSTEDNEMWSIEYLETVADGAQDLEFVNDDLAFNVVSEAALCECCFLGVKKFTPENNWETSIDHTTYGANCFASIGYSFISFANEEVGYILLGSRILKTTDGGMYTSLKTDDYSIENKIKLYPNPTTQNMVTLEFADLDVENASAEILNIQGKKIKSVAKLQSSTSINISGLTNGVYFISILKNNKVVANKKLLVSH